ncbi:dihydroneopterin aldolase [Acetohalobium arabaticum]|uniref:7,8-dihydroneopterin aldolase n=1 Tax=Acetohalobium arabaticum (strain ATCC 49924 / DSM 5501 / Z-7288) TaxID=574087 RepID=D9QRZ6_ACEAZ|nr:dihydroneopterin aldolase [Acetohalobium arabaticum]ADL13287.1 dihydroneopterin aldolase [Acetohalobium arabaticum DSM 5501]
MSDYIRLEGLEFYGYHGALAEEKELGQRFIVDLELEIDLQEAGMTDRLDQTINYAEVYQKVKEIVEGDSYDLIEAVAEKIADSLLRDYSILEGIAVRVKKPEVPIPGVLDWVEVEIERSSKS